MADMTSELPSELQLLRDQLLMEVRDLFHQLEDKLVFDPRLQDKISQQTQSTVTTANTATTAPKPVPLFEVPDPKMEGLPSRVASVPRPPLPFEVAEPEMESVPHPTAKPKSVQDDLQDLDERHDSDSHPNSAWGDKQAFRRPSHVSQSSDEDGDP